MDIARKSAKRKRRIRYTLYGLSLAVAIGLTTVGLSRLKPARLSVDRESLWIDTVKRGSMLRQVRGSGTLIPEDIRWITASTDGLIERIYVQPGAEVTGSTLLIEISSPELEQAALDAELQVKAAEAESANLSIKLEKEQMQQQAAAAGAAAAYQEARLNADADEALAQKGLVPALKLKVSKAKSEELATRYKIEQQGIEVNNRSARAQISAQQARLEQLRALARLKRGQVESLHVKAQTAGVIQQIPVEIGQRITAGTNLARVAQPKSLKAELKIPETQAKDILLGQAVSVDTRNGIVKGTVARIDPAVQDKTVTVDVTFTGPLPKGVRPDLAVDGTIELERLDDVLYAGRPIFGVEQGSTKVFKLADDGRSAVPVDVKFGRSSTSTVEILEGLQAGDQVILSDTSAWASHDRIVID